MGLLSLTWGSTQSFAVEPAEAFATITGINCDRAGDGVTVSYRLVRAFGQQVKDALEGGETVRFTHDLTVTRRRKGWFSKTLSTMSIETTVSLDTLTHQYTLGRKIGEGQPEVTTTDRADEADRWLSVVDRVRVDLPPGSARAETLDLKVKATYGRDFLLFLFLRPLTADDRAECR